jgi:hypothetical protein
MEFLKPILGDQLYMAVSQKLKDREDVKLANLAGGAYVAKEKFLAATTKIAALEASLKAANEKLTAVADAAKKIAELEAALAKCAKEKELIGKQCELRLIALKKQSEIDKALLECKARNMKAVRALIDDSRIVVKDGMLTGLSEQINAIKVSDPYLFEQESDTGGGGNPVAPPDKSMKINPDRLDDRTFYNIKFKK